MDNNYLQQQRFLLQKRIKRLNSCDYKLFHSLFVQFWRSLHNNALFSGVLAKLAAEAPAYAAEVAAAKQKLCSWSIESEAMHFTFRALEHCAAHPVDATLGPEISFGRVIEKTSSQYSDILDAFREAYLEPFYEYLDEALDGQAAVLSLLLKYKRNVEWFERDHVRGLVAQGERHAAKHLYAYLFDQGLEFHIEPQSASGEADLVARDLVLEAKLFDGSSSSNGKRSVLNGVNQLLAYLRDHHQQAGYLVVYRMCPEDLQFSFSRDDMLVPFLAIDGRIVYFLTIDVCEYGASASKRGTMKAHLLTEDEVRRILE